MTGEEIDAIAEATAAKIARGLLRMPEELRIALARLGPGNVGHYTMPGSLTPGPDSFYLQALARPGGIQLEIKRPDGSLAWSAVIV